MLLSNLQFEINLYWTTACIALSVSCQQQSTFIALSAILYRSLVFFKEEKYISIVH